IKNNIQEVVAPLKPMEEENGGNEDIEIINANLPSLSIINVGTELYSDFSVEESSTTLLNSYNMLNNNLISVSNATLINSEENHDANFLGEFACGTTVACVPNTDSIHDEDGDSILIYDELVVINERLGPWSGYEHLLLLKSVLERK
ncbi:5242_t:CDS:2, partial [Entrophospora sp. SA101]